MKFLFVVKQKKNIDTFEGVIAALLGAGHAVTLAIEERGTERDRRLLDRYDSPRFELTACPEGRGDQWRASAGLVRSVRDWAQYLKPAYTRAAKLRRRAADRLLRELAGEASLDAGAVVLDAAGTSRLHATLERIERAIPSDALHEEFIAGQQPDVVLVTPGLHFGSGQADYIKSARSLGIPVWMLLFSWDNLSTKGALHAAPDLIFVWNERQRREAAELHDFPADRVVVVGAPRFDEFFELRSVVPRKQFFEPLALDPSRPTLLYLCSSRFIAEHELEFLKKWLAAVRGAQSDLRHANVIARPHPDIALVDEGLEPRTVTWPGMPQVTGWIQRPFDDPAAIVLRTTYRTQQAFFECLHHSHAVVALNTSAELEAGIAGRPVFTVLAAEDGADGQGNTLHFEYLLRDHGGFVAYAPDLPAHVEQLNRSLTSSEDAGHIRAFILEFLRPCGDQAVAQLLARTLVERLGTDAVRRAGRAAHGADAPASGEATLHEIAEAETGSRPEKVLRVASGDSTVKVLATPETRRWRRQGVLLLDPAVLRWLNEHVRPGDVVYDIGAGVGACTLLAARERGSLAVAFEPGFGAFKALCENIILNGCQGSVMPLPIALGRRVGLLELEYPHTAGADLHSLRPRAWRSKRQAMDSRYTQPVCAERLDDVVRRYGLPPPNAIRIALRGTAEEVLGGAVNSLRSATLRSVLVSVEDEAHTRAVLEAAGGTGLTATAAPAHRDHGIAIVMHRTRAARAAIRPSEIFRQTTDRLRRLW